MFNRSLDPTEDAALSLFVTKMRRYANRPFSKMAAENSNKFKLAKLINVYQH